MKTALEILWPSFLVACVAEMLFFSILDPADLHFLGAPLELDRTTIYSLGFFAFWMMTATSSFLTKWLYRRQ